MAAIEVSTALPGHQVSYARRFLGDFLLEYLIFSFTLGIGWFFWFASTARHGQTPAKQLLGVRIYDYRTGALATPSQVVSREIVGKYVFPFLLSLFGILVPESLVVLVLLIEAFHWFGITLIFFNRDRRALWELHCHTVVRRLQTGREREPMPPVDFAAERVVLDAKWGSGEISSEEYSRRLLALHEREAVDERKQSAE